MRKLLFFLFALLLALPAAAMDVPILMYHHFTETDTGLPDRCSAEAFRTHLEALTAAGYTSVSFRQLLDWTDGTGTLPEKPVILTSDDGYRSVLDIALPLLQEYGMTMSVAVVGSRLGSADGIPHFSLDDAAGSGLELLSHTWDLHGPTGCGVLTPAGTMDPRLPADIARMRQIPELAADVFVYPYGKFTPDTDALLSAFGYRITVTTRYGIADVRQGKQDTLRLLPRIPMDGNGDLSWIQNSTGRMP